MINNIGPSTQFLQLLGLNIYIYIYIYKFQTRKETETEHSQTRKETETKHSQTTLKPYLIQHILAKTCSQLHHIHSRKYKNKMASFEDKKMQITQMEYNIRIGNERSELLSGI